jgi:glucuronoarabinoxylan endo-1,4-beta-xylanase
MRRHSSFLRLAQLALLILASMPVGVGCGGKGRTSGSAGSTNMGTGGSAGTDDPSTAEAGIGGNDFADAGPDGPVISVSIDPAVRHQTLVGFGAAAAYYTSYLSDRRMAGDDIYNVLFTDLGLDILRVANWYQTQVTSGATASTAFSDNAMATIVQKATAELGHAPALFMSSWSPPSYLKSTGVTKPAAACDAGTCQGTLVRDGNGAFEYGALADWWVASLAAYAAHGVVPDYISIQNEPDFFSNDWETCRYDATEGANAAYGRALDAVFGAVQSSALASKPRFIGPETSGIRGNRLAGYVNAAVDPSQIDAIAHHLYNGGGTGNNPGPDTFTGAMTTIANVAGSAQKPIFMTEYSPPMPAMFETAWLIHNALTVEGVSAYVYWELFWAPSSTGVPTALVTLDNPSALTTPRGYKINDTYYAVKHFAKWTDPGHVRIDAASSDPLVKVSAFVAPGDSSITVVVLNTDPTYARQVQLDAVGYAFSSEAVYRSSGTAERTAAVTPADNGVVPMPPRSIATITLTK